MNLQKLKREICLKALSILVPKDVTFNHGFLAWLNANQPGQKHTVFKAIWWSDSKRRDYKLGAVKKQQHDEAVISYKWSLLKKKISEIRPEETYL